MPRTKKHITIPTPEAVIAEPPKRRRGRPRKEIAPEALLPFKASELVTVETFDRLSKKASRSKTKSSRPMPNPATGTCLYTAEEVEFMDALAEFKRASGHIFPTCSEILAVIHELGYEKIR